MKSENNEEAEIFKSELVGLIKSNGEADHDQESAGKVKQNRTSELSSKNTCKICDFRFGQKKDLKKHNRLLHATDANAPKMLVCDTCEFKFGRRQLLENHMKAQHLK